MWAHQSMDSARCLPHTQRRQLDRELTDGRRRLREEDEENQSWLVSMLNTLFFWFWYVFFFLTNWMKCETNESYKKMLFMCNFSALTFLLSFSILYKNSRVFSFSHRERERESRAEQGWARENHLEGFVFFVEKHCVRGGKSINSNMAMKWKVCFPNQSSKIK